MKEIYLAGGCYWGVQKYCDSIRGVHETEVGFANGFVPAPSYEQVKHSQTGHAETVRVCYDETVLPLDCLLRLFFRMIDPTELDRQGNDVGHQYRTGVYWRAIDHHMNALHIGRPGRVGLAVGVADVVSRSLTFPANVAYS